VLLLPSLQQNMTYLSAAQSKCRWNKPRYSLPFIHRLQIRKSVFGNQCML